MTDSTQNKKLEYLKAFKEHLRDGGRSDGAMALNLAMGPSKEWIAGYKAAKAESPWVSIDQIPEDWRDGRPVDLLVYNENTVKTERYTDCRYEGFYWSSYYNGSKESRPVPGDVTHAMISPPPPESEGG